MEHAGIPAFILVGIVVGYLVIAGQFFKEFRKSKGNAAKKATALMLGIFVLCALAGYVPQIFGMPYYMKLVIHVSLVCMTWWFIMTNQVRHIAKALG